MKDWKASVRGWHGRNKDTPKSHLVYPKKPRVNEALEKMKKWEEDAKNNKDV